MPAFLCRGCTADLETWGGKCPHCGSTQVLDVSPRGDPMLGRTVAGRFRVVRKLGQGGMGRVYLAEQLGVEQTVALKFLNPEYSDDPQIARRFLQEAKSAGRVAHPQAVLVHDFGQDEDGSLFIAMEYVEGTDLRKLLAERGRLGPADAVEIVLQAAEVLAHAHARGVVHRDLKPENLIVRRGLRGWHVKVLDFGIAKLVETTATRHTRQGTAAGTPRYMAPEQIEGRSVDGRADVYALGLVLFELLVGRTPFDAPSLGEVLRRQLSAPTPHLSEVAPDLRLPALDTVIQKATAKAREQRYSDAKAFLSALGGAKDSGAAVSPRPSPRAAPRGRRIRAVGVVATLATTAAIVLWAQRWPVSPRHSPAAEAGPPAEVASPQATAADAVAHDAASRQSAANIDDHGSLATGDRPTIPDGRAGEETRGLAAARAPAPADDRSEHAITGDAKEAPRKLASLEVRSNVDADALYINGERVGTTGAKRYPVAPGPVLVRIEKKGFKPIEQAVTLAPGQMYTSYARLEAIEAPAAPIAPAALVDIEAAERSLAARQPEDALRAARHSLYAQKTGRAFSIMTRAHCQLGDMGNARATLQSVPSQDRARVLAECSALGVDLR